MLRKNNPWVATTTFLLDGLLDGYVLMIGAGILHHRLGVPLMSYGTSLILAYVAGWVLRGKDTLATVYQVVES